MDDKIGFPTQGEAVSYLFKVFGILPAKRDPRVDELEKKQFQRLLKRLRDEEGLLLKNFDIAVETFKTRLERDLSDPSAREVIIKVLAELHYSYSRLLVEEGTYRSKVDTLGYFLFTRAISTFVEAVTFHLLCQRMLVHDDLICRKLSLLLPDLSDDGKIVWPLTKAIRWVYEQADTSQRQFHLPDESSEKNWQNLENAGHWVRGEHLPSLPDLLANFSESFAAQEKTRSTPDGLIDTMPVMLALARVSTAVCKDIVDAYGTDSLYRFLGILRSYFQGIGSEVEEFKAEISGYYEIDDIVDLPDQRWQFACSHFRRHLDNKKRESSETLKKLRFASPIRPFKPDVIDALSKRLGVYPVRSNLDPILDAAGWMPDPEFLWLLNRGFEIKNRPCIEERDIVQFERDLGSSRVDDQLCWLSPWIRAIYLYRKGSFDESLCYFEQAFSSARYRAGSYQYLLVNQYLEVCAKNDRRGKFKVALGWANYAGIQVRWLRGEEQTEEAIDFAFEVFKHVTYPV